jgi:cytidylate kinase
LRYLDTGAQFRALTVWMLRHRVDLADPAAIAAHAAGPRVESGTDPANPTIRLDGEDVSAAIRSADTTDAVSAVASGPAVRDRLLRLRRGLIGAGGIVVEGRDIGSVVAPAADVKVYLTADPAARAARRTAELHGAGPAAEGGARSGGDVAATEADLLRRDRIDSTRATAPLTVPEGAVHIDTTPFTLAEVVEQIVALVEAVPVSR